MYIWGFSWYLLRIDCQDWYRKLVAASATTACITLIFVSSFLDIVLEQKLLRVENAPNCSVQLFFYWYHLWIVWLLSSSFISLLVMRIAQNSYHSHSTAVLSRWRAWRHEFDQNLGSVPTELYNIRDILRPGVARIAVAQTRYSAGLDDARPLERIRRHTTPVKLTNPCLFS